MHVSSCSYSQSTSISCQRRDSSVDETDTESGMSDWQDSSCSDSEMVSSTSAKKSHKKSGNKSLDLDSSGLKEYLNLSSSTKDALKQKLIGDRRDYEEMIQKKCELLAGMHSSVVIFF